MVEPKDITVVVELTDWRDPVKVKVTANHPIRVIVLDADPKSGWMDSEDDGPMVTLPGRPIEQFELAFDGVAATEGFVLPNPPEE